VVELQHEDSSKYGLEVQGLNWKNWVGTACSHLRSDPWPGKAPVEGTPVVRKTIGGAGSSPDKPTKKDTTS